VAAAANGIAEKLPGKWKLIQSLHVKTADSAALPIYNVLPEADAEAPATDATPATETKKDKAAKPKPKPAAQPAETKASQAGSAAKRTKAAAKPSAAKRVKMAA
jgi:ribosome biogenesis protein UTP30